MLELVRTRCVMRTGLSGLLICGLLVTATQTLAQSAQDESESVLEEVLVTAQKREQNAQRVPISVQAFSAETMHQLREDPSTPCHWKSF